MPSDPKTRQKKYQLLAMKRRLNNECYRCGVALGDNYSYRACPKCLKTKRSYKDTRLSRVRAAARKLGLCIYHPDREAVPGRRLCDPCLERCSELSQRWVHRKRKEAEEAGMCTVCFKRKAREKFKHCEECTEKFRQKKHRNKINREARKNGYQILRKAV